MMSDAHKSHFWVIIFASKFRFFFCSFESGFKKQVLRKEKKKKICKSDILRARERITKQNCEFLSIFADLQSFLVNFYVSISKNHKFQSQNIKFRLVMLNQNILKLENHKKMSALQIKFLLLIYASSAQ